MMKTRVMPVLLLMNGGLVKTVNFKNPKYVGDPINAVKIFNEKCVDELVILDITASKENRKPPMDLLRKIASEAFMPVCYGGGISTLQDIKEILSLGVEKVAINTAAVENPNFIKQASELFGSQSVVVSIDVIKSFWKGYQVVTRGGRKSTNLDPVRFAMEMERLGAGEILLNSIDRDGTMEGYDITLLSNVTRSLTIPLIACGGAGKVDHFVNAVKNGGVSAVAAGSMFVFHGKHRAVLITFPSDEDLEF